MITPTREVVRAWIGVPAASLTDDQLDAIIAAETAAQAAVCTIDDLDDYPDLAQALLRRIARHVAARAVPTGLVGEAEYGIARLPSFDAEIERYERHHRTQVLA